MAPEPKLHYLTAMMRSILIFCAALLLAAPLSLAQDSGLTEEQQDLQNRLEALAGARGERGETGRAMLSFYAGRNFELVWFGTGGLNARGEALLRRLEAAQDQGLDPAWYGIPRLREQASRAPLPEMPAAEVALTRTLIRYAQEVRAGHVDMPNRIGTRTAPAAPGAVDILASLSRAGDIETFLDGLPPQTRRYRRMIDALARYRAIAEAGGWESVASGETLKPGMRAPRVVQVRERLRATGDLAGEAAEDPMLFDDALAAAVRGFQDRHGLTVDGEVGADTRTAMNIPVRERIRQLVINIERRRWRVGLLENRYVWVNAAAQQAKLVENDHTVFVTRIIVGTSRLQTPEFSARMTYIQFNPYWNVPRSIAVNEMLPRIKRDPGYLTRNHYLLLRSAGDNSTAINPHNVDWSQIGRSNFPFAIRQKPGNHNALGRLILRFPNRFNVYMHDTPSCELFEREVRTFSHGCIRTENPHVLAALILRRQTDDWPESRILEVTTGQETPVIQVDIINPPWVHITYITAWADADGTVEFRRDVYNRDPALMRAMGLR